MVNIAVGNCPLHWGWLAATPEANQKPVFLDFVVVIETLGVALIFSASPAGAGRVGLLLDGRRALRAGRRRSGSRPPASRPGVPPPTAKSSARPGKASPCFPKRSRSTVGPDYVPEPEG